MHYYFNSLILLLDYFLNTNQNTKIICLDFRS